MRLVKKIIISVLALVLVVAGAVAGYNLVHYKLYREYKNYLTDTEYNKAEGTVFQALPDSGNEVAGMKLAAENELLKLYVNTEDASVAIYDKRNGTTVYSNPPEADNDPIASKTNKAYLKSQMVIDFYNSSKVSVTYNSYDYAVANGQVAYETIPDGLRVLYTIGDLSSETGIVPIYITSERLEGFLAKIDEKDAKYVRNRYKESGTVNGFLELTEGARGAATLRKITNYLTEAGYSEEEYLADTQAAGVATAVPTSFEIMLEYRLDGDSVVVTLPTTEIVENGDGQLYKITLLRFFGAAGTDEEGYMLVPNGSGSLINFNNDKTEATDYVQYVYGNDPLAQDYTVLGNSELCRLPIFGIQRENSGILAVIEDGAAYAQINAHISGKTCSYNAVYSAFTLRGYEKMSMFGSTGSEADMPIVESDMYKTNITMRYSLLTNEYEGYSGMANYYRETLEDEGILTRVKAADSIPLYADVIGGVKGTAFFLGVQYLDVIPMTTFEEAKEIYENLKTRGISNVVMNYQGWFNGGYYHEVPDKIKLVKDLGSKKELEALSDTLEASGGKLYADVAFQKVTFIAERFNYTRESSRYYAGGYVASFGQVSPISYYQTSSLGYVETKYDLLSPKFLPRYVKKFAEKMEAYDVTGISLRDLGDTLHSDKKRTEVIARGEALDVVLGQFETLAETGKELMVSGGNFYSLFYADDAINVPLCHNSNVLFDAEVPFYEMLIHGYVNYAGAATNLSDTFDEDELVLRLVEYGASPHFTYTYEEANKMKYTGLNSFYSTRYETWADMTERVYDRVNAALHKTVGAAMISHEIAQNGMRIVDYDNGVRIYVNPTAETLSSDGVEVAAMSYVVKEAGE